MGYREKKQVRRAIRMIEKKSVLHNLKDQVDEGQLSQGNAFGFTQSEIPNSLEEDSLVHTEVVEEAEEPKDSSQTMLKVLQIVMPLMYNLRNSADTSDTIHWPNRKAELDKQIKRINKLTGNIYEEKD